MLNEPERINSSQGTRRKLLNEEPREKINDILYAEFQYLYDNGLRNKDRETNRTVRDVLDVFEFINKHPMAMRRPESSVSSRINSEMPDGTVRPEGPDGTIRGEIRPEGPDGTIRGEIRPEMPDGTTASREGGRRRTRKTKKSSRRRHR